MQKTQQPTSPEAIQRVVTPPPVSFNWFGGEVQAKQAVADIPKELATANINAKLLGVVIAGADSSATMKYSGALERVYFKGDELDNNTTIVEIQPYRIVVNQNGVNKQIVMEKPDAVITSEQGSAATGDAASNGFALANMFGAVPVMAGGSTGFKINNLSTEVQQLADIQEGDVVTKVNGVSIRDIMADPSQWMQFSTSTSLPVTVLRNGQEQVIYINASSLSAKMLPNLGFKP
jgi:type II secretion system protein C